jgi:hypothetical protein
MHIPCLHAFRLGVSFFAPALLTAVHCSESILHCALLALIVWPIKNSAASTVTLDVPLPCLNPLLRNLFFSAPRFTWQETSTATLPDILGLFIVFLSIHHGGVFLRVVFSIALSGLASFFTSTYQRSPCTSFFICGYSGLSCHGMKTHYPKSVLLAYRRSLAIS